MSTEKQPIAVRFAAADPCPVCGSGSKGCSVTADGLHLCRGELTDPAVWTDVCRGNPDAAGFRHYRRKEDRHPARVRRGSGAPPRRDWRSEAERFAERLDAERRAELAVTLRLPVEALAALPLTGWKADERCWTFPECDPDGTVVGITRRSRAGTKKMLKGGSRGLTLPSGWRDRPGPVFVVEGASDTLAMTHAGLSCVGRPSNSGGTGMLAQLLGDLPADRDVYIVGENDRKPSGHWPGRDGAMSVAKTIASALGRRVCVTLPPAESKDARDRLTDAARGGTPWSDRGSELSNVFLANGEPIDPPAALTEGSSGRPADCPEIVVGTDEFRVNEAAAAALAREDDLYQMGGLLVHVMEHDDPAPEGAVRRPAGGPYIRDLPKPLLRERLTRCARWLEQKVNKEGPYTVPAHPPGWAVDAVHVHGNWPHVRRLEAVVTHPVVLPDGSLLTDNGYHRPSGILVRVPAELAIRVPDSPTRADVAAAVDTLFDPLADFPFETPAHRAAHIAGLLTPLAWFAFTGPAPLFLIDANVRAAGKGLLCDVIALALTGRRFPVMAYTNDREELRKRITTAAVEGERLIQMDNLAGAVGNDILDAALTSDRWKDRLLGGNRMFDGPLQVTWFGTGNNVQLAADTSRRVCHVRLESREERPEMRDGYKYRDLRARVRATRGALVSAALTILRGWFAAGKPTHGLKPWGSYEPWSDVVREALVFAGLPDPGDTRIALQTAADRDAGALCAIINGLARMDPGRRGLTAGEVVTRLKGINPAEEWADMRSAVEDLCGKLDGRELGYKLRHFQRRNFGGRMIDKAGVDGQKSTRWAVFDVRPSISRSEPPPSPSATPRPGDAGDEGDVPAPKKPGGGVMPSTPVTPCPSRDAIRSCRSQEELDSMEAGVERAARGGGVSELDRNWWAEAIRAKREQIADRIGGSR